MMAKFCKSIGWNQIKPRLCLTKFAWAFFWDPFLDFGFKNGQRRFFISSGNRSHILAPKLEIVSIPQCVVRIFLRVKWFPLLKLYVGFSWKIKKSFIISGQRSFLTLNYSVAKYYKFFIWTDTDLPCLNKVSKPDFLSW